MTSTSLTCLDQLNGLGRLRVKRMFGGAGVYCSELFFPILLDHKLYFKVDHPSRRDYERMGLKLFTFERKNSPTATMGYYPVPADMLEDTNQLKEWANTALEAARQGKRQSRQ